MLLMHFSELLQVQLLYYYTFNAVYGNWRSGPVKRGLQITQYNLTKPGLSNNQTPNPPLPSGLGQKQAQLITINS